MGTGKQQAITITGHSGLDEKEIDRMVKDADAHSEEDKRRKEVVEVKNQGDQMVYSLEKLLRENKDRISESDAERVRTEIENTKKAMESEDLQRIKSAIESLSQASHKLTETLYQQAGPGRQQQAAGNQGGQSGGQSSTPGGGEEEVIDAEVVDEEKKN
jgi:molecular chaperone DnaK